VRPVNLIPLEHRRGEKASMRTGPVPYVIVAILGVALIAVTMVTMTNNTISDREAEKASLQPQVEAAQLQAQRLASYADFAALQQARELTVASLAQSRFDWERVLRELAIVIPHDVWLTDLSAQASSDATGTAGSSGSTSGIEGPSLQISGCAAGHEAVAGFLASLRDIDGLTRATVFSSDRSTQSATGGGPTSGSSGTGGSGDGCSTRDFLATFEITAAFDAAQPIASVDGSISGTSVAPSPASTTTATGTEASTQASASDQSQVSAPELQQQKDSAAQKEQKGHKAVDTFIPGTGSAP